MRLLIIDCHDTTTAEYKGVFSIGLRPKKKFGGQVLEFQQAPGPSHQLRLGMPVDCQWHGGPGRS